MPSSKLKTKPKPKLAVDWSFEAIGTSWWIGLYETIDDTALATLKQAVAKRIEQFDQTYSRFQTDSLVTSISRQAGTYMFPPDATDLFGLYRQLYELSDGRVTPLIGQLLSDAGYDASYSLKPGKLVSPPTWESVCTFRDSRLTTAQPLLLDFGAAGKGYLVDIIAELLEQAGVSSFCVDAGGDMVCRGLDQPLKIGLEHPDDAEQAIGVFDLENQALCGSAGNRRAWAGYNHIMDPKLLNSPDHIKAVWVSADSALVADGLTTALYFVPPEQLNKRFQFEYLVVYNDNSMQYSPGFSAHIFTEELARV